MTDRAAKSAQLIADCWAHGTKLAALPSDCRPQDLAEGYKAQCALEDALHQPVVGWKIAATSARGQKHIGVDGPIAGRLFASRIVEGGAQVSMHGNAMAAGECEFVFRLAQDLPARAAPYSREEVMAAVAAVHPGLEVPDSRFEDFAAAGAAQLAADNACTHWMAIGPASDADWREIDFSTHATCLRIDARTVTEGTGADVLGDPRDALTWLANNHALQGASLRAGQYITTGVTGQPSPIQTGQRVTADLGALGQVTVSLISDGP